MREKKNRIRNLWVGLFILAVMLVTPATAREVHAQTAGFQTIDGKSYYITKTGEKQKGWLTLNRKKYYFDSKTGVQLKGWQKDGTGKKIRYFTKGSGVMVTGFISSGKYTRYFNPKDGKMVRGWLTLKGKKYYFTSGSGIMVRGWLQNGKGQKRYFRSNGQMATGEVKSSSGSVRYFNTKSGIMLTGLQKLSGNYYYFSKSTGVRYQKGFGKVGSNRYYFSPSDGKAQIGWLTLDGKRYYFSSKGVMYRNTTATVDGVSYKFSSSGVATKKGTVSGNGITFTHYDAKNGRNYTIMNEFNEHPGVADGSKSDLDLLAAVCECEAGDQGIAGMKAVALCILNRTIYKGGDFPSEVRYVIYQGTTFPQYSVVTNGNLLKRLNGQFDDRASAYKAARQAMNAFNAYVTKGTPRKVSGTKAKDFNYMYFMMTYAFWKQPLNFNKVVYETYKDHTFFVDWV